MTKEKALKILGLRDLNSVDELKKQYRSLMQIVHPDVKQNKANKLNKQDKQNKLSHLKSMDARDINLAYEYLLKNIDEVLALASNMEGKATSGFYQTNTAASNQSKSAQRNRAMRWSAPINPGAYRARNIYHEIEDQDGMVIGESVLDAGKFYWTEDEEFPLFLKSLYECGKNIVSEYSERRNINGSMDEDVRLLSQIVYLLSQQFVDSEMVLTLFGNKISEQGSNQDLKRNSGQNPKQNSEQNPENTSEPEIYKIDAMLELNENIHSNRSLCAGQLLFPTALRDHKLFVSDASGAELGYLSFRDDRLYYGVIPL